MVKLFNDHFNNFKFWKLKDGPNMGFVKDIINLDAVPSRRHENFCREGHLVTIGVRETETVSLSLTPIATRCPSRRKFSCRHRI